MWIKIILFLLLLNKTVFCGGAGDRKVTLIRENSQRQCTDKIWTRMELQLSDNVSNNFLFPIVSFQGNPLDFWIRKNKNHHIACDFIYTSQERVSPEAGGLPLLGKEEKRVKECLHRLLSLSPYEDEEDYEEQVYRQGSIWWANLKNLTSESNDKHRPVLIISKSSYNTHSDEVLILTITSKKSYGCYAKYKVPIDLEEKSYIDCLSIHRIPKEELKAFRKTHNQASGKVLRNVKRKLHEIFS